MSDTGKAYENKISDPVDEVAQRLGGIGVVYIYNQKVQLA